MFSAGPLDHARGALALLGIVALFASGLVAYAVGSCR